MGDAAGNGIDALISLASGALLLTPQAIDDGIDSIRIALDPFNIIWVGLELSGHPVLLFAQKDSHSIQNLDCISILDAPLSRREVACGLRNRRQLQRVHSVGVEPKCLVSVDEGLLHVLFCVYAIFRSFHQI